MNKTIFFIASVLMIFLVIIDGCFIIAIVRDDSFSLNWTKVFATHTPVILFWALATAILALEEKTD